MNYHLNPGGLIGAIAFGAAAAAILFAVDFDKVGGRGTGKLFVISVCLGAGCGNWLWVFLSPKPRCPRCDRKLPRRNARLCDFCDATMRKP